MAAASVRHLLLPADGLPGQRASLISPPQSSRIELPDTDLEAISCFLEYLYTGEYFPAKLSTGALASDPSTPPIDETGAQLLKHAKVYTLAEKLGVAVRSRFPLSLPPTSSFPRALYLQLAISSLTIALSAILAPQIPLPLQNPPRHLVRLGRTHIRPLCLQPYRALRYHHPAPCGVFLGPTLARAAT